MPWRRLVIFSLMVMASLMSAAKLLLPLMLTRDSAPKGRMEKEEGEEASRAESRMRVSTG